MGLAYLITAPSDSSDEEGVYHLPDKRSLSAVCPSFETAFPLFFLPSPPLVLGDLANYIPSLYHYHAFLGVWVPRHLVVSRRGGSVNKLTNSKRTRWRKGRKKTTLTTRMRGLHSDLLLRIPSSACAVTGHRHI